MGKKRHGNRDWGPQGVAPMPSWRAAAFEQIAEHMGLSPEQYASSAELKEWARANRRQKYVPIDLLKTWGFEVERL